METSQPICKVNKLAGFHMIQAFTGRFFRTDNSNNWDFDHSMCFLGPHSFS